MPKELRDWLELQRHKRTAGDIVDPKSATVTEWFTTWLEVHKPDIRSMTRESYDNIIRNRIVPHIGAVKLMALDATLLQNFINRQAKEYSARGAQYVRVILKMGLKDAVRMGYLKSNPAEYVKAPRQVKTELVTPSEEMIVKMLEAAQKSKFGVYFLLLAASGARRGEILALRWSDVDFQNKSVRIARTLVYSQKQGILFNEPKTSNSKRSIILPADVVSTLKDHHKKQLKLKKENKEIWKDYDLVFPVQDGGPQNPHNIENAFRRIMQAAGLGEEVVETDDKGKETRWFRTAFRIHDLRHAQASMLMLGGENPEAVRKRMGHHSAAFTMSVYTHASQKIDKQIADKLKGKYVKSETKPAEASPKNKSKKRKT